LRIESWELHLPLFEPINDSRDQQDGEEKNALRELLNFMVVKCAVSNEIGTHADLLDISKVPGQVYRYLAADLRIRSNPFKPDAVLPRFQSAEMPTGERSWNFTFRAKLARAGGVNAPQFGDRSAKIFIANYTRFGVRILNTADKSLHKFIKEYLELKQGSILRAQG